MLAVGQSFGFDERRVICFTFGLTLLASMGLLISSGKSGLSFYSINVSCVPRVDMKLRIVEALPGIIRVLPCSSTPKAFRGTNLTDPGSYLCLYLELLLTVFPAVFSRGIESADELFDFKEDRSLLWLKRCKCLSSIDVLRVFNFLLVISRFVI